MGGLRTGNRLWPRSDNSRALEGQADSWRRHLSRKQARRKPLGDRPSLLPLSLQGNGLRRADVRGTQRLLVPQVWWPQRDTLLLSSVEASLASAGHGWSIRLATEAVLKTDEPSDRPWGFDSLTIRSPMRAQRRDTTCRVLRQAVHRGCRKALPWLAAPETKAALVRAPVIGETSWL